MNLSSSPFTIAIVKLLQAQSILQESLSTLVRTGSQQTGCAGAILYQFGLPRLKSRFPVAITPMPDTALPPMHATTILMVRKGGRVVIGGDGQVSPRPDHRQGQRQEGAPARQGRR